MMLAKPGLQLELKEKRAILGEAVVSARKQVREPVFFFFFFFFK